MIVKVWSLVDIQQDIELPDDLNEQQVVEAIRFGTIDDEPIDIKWPVPRRYGDYHRTVEIWDEEFDNQIWVGGDK